MTRMILLLALLLAACGPGASQGGGTSGAYVGGSAGANYRGDSALR